MRCPKCNAENPPGNKFCGQCGNNLQKAAGKDRIDMVKQDIPESLVKKILHTKDTIEKERKDVTVIFSDISGFTTMSEKLDPEELTLLMNECFRKLSGSVYRYEGIIDKFIGDCIMAIFGAPVTHEDDPERAVLACLDMQFALNEINKDLASSLKKLQIHSGINTGQVIAGKVGSDLQMDYTVMGDTVNVAQRLKDIATKGNILVGPETYKRTRHAFDFMPMDPVHLKGKAERIQPYEVVGKKMGAEYGLSVLRSDLIGRDKEIEQLKNGYKELKQKNSSIYIVNGEIGVGKSRLFYEFKKFLTISAPEILLIDGRGVSYESMTPYKAFADAIRHSLLGSESMATENHDDLIKARIKEFLKEEADEVAPYILKLLNIDLTKKYSEKVKHLDSHSLQLQIFLAITTLLEKFTDSNPTILVFDDIQWMDKTSLELLTFVLPIVKRRAIAFYLSYRVGDLSSIQDFLDTLAKEYENILSRIALHNLDSQHSQLLIENLMGQDIDTKLKDYIIEKSEGNPFFIEEIVRNYFETGVHKAKEKPAEQIKVPGSIEAAVSSRIDGLKKETKYLLRIASIIGRSFPQDLLKAIVKEKDIYQHIEDLEESEFLIRINKDNIPHYSFRHALFQEVAYNTLLKSERIIYHKVIAETIEAKFRDKIDSFYTILAHHYCLSQNAEKTLHYAVKAGDQAAQLHANKEALSQYQLALSMAQDNTPEKAEILEKMGDIEKLTGAVNEATEHFESAKKHISDEMKHARINGKIAHILLHTGNVDKAIALFKKSLKDIADAENETVVDLDYLLADALIENKAATKEAGQLIEHGVRIARKLNNKQLEADGIRAKAHVLWRDGNTKEALTLLKKSQHIYEKIKDRRYLPNVFIILGVFYRALGDVPRAIDYVQKAIVLAQKTGNQRILSIGYNNLGIYYDLIGDFEHAVRYYEKNLDIREKIHDKKGTGIGLLNIGILKNNRGKLKEALDYYLKAKKVFEEVNDIRAMFHIYSTIGTHYERFDNNKKAEEYYKRAMKIAQETNERSLLSGINLVYAQYYRNQGNYEQALEYLKKTEEIMEDDTHRQSDFILTAASIYVKLKDPRALKLSEEGIQLAQKMNVKTTEIRALMNLGKAQALIKADFANGIKNIKRAISLAKDLNYLSQLAESYYVLGQVYAEQKDSKKAIDHLCQAKEIFSSINELSGQKKAAELIQNLS